jgi:hypothetical protein
MPQAVFLSLPEKIADDASLRRVQDVRAAIRHGGCLLEEITEAEYWSLPPETIHRGFRCLQ